MESKNRIQTQRNEKKNKSLRNCFFLLNIQCPINDMIKSTMSSKIELIIKDYSVKQMEIEQQVTINPN